MECADNNSIIITLAILTHGKVVSLNIESDIFDNVRLFSKSGDFEDVATTHLAERVVLNKVYELFRTDLNEPSINIMKNYVEYSQPKYKSFLKFMGNDNVNVENVCRLFSNITIDKIFSKIVTRPPGLLSTLLCFVDYIIPEFQGVFLVSAHRKINNNTYELIYPRDNISKNIDLLDLNNLREFALFFGKELPNLRIYSSQLPSVYLYEEREIAIKNDKTKSEEEKNILIEELHSEIFGIINEWKLTINRGKIDSIKMSMLVSIIKQIVGTNCNINLLDYSCNSITKYIPKEQKENMRYFEPMDIESGENIFFGGKKTKRNKKRRRKTRKHK